MRRPAGKNVIKLLFEHFSFYSLSLFCVRNKDLTINMKLSSHSTNLAAQEN